MKSIGKLTQKRNRLVYIILTPKSIAGFGIFFAIKSAGTKIEMVGKKVDFEKEGKELKPVQIDFQCFIVYQCFI